MDEPLGPAVGTGIEAIEARDFLRGTARDPRLAEAALAVAHEMLRVAGLLDEEIPARAQGALEGGAAYERFVQMIEAQGGTRAALEALAVDRARCAAVAPGEGVVVAIDTVAIGELAREFVEADGPFAGIRIVARVGSAVRVDDVLAECAGASADAERVARAFHIGDIAPANRVIVDTIVRDDALSAEAEVA
jgi:thymidine phosphorylase